MPNTDGEIPGKSDTASKVAFTLGVLGTGLLGLGPLVANLRITLPMAGFSIFLVGLLLGVVTLPLAMVCWARFRAAERRNAAERRLTLTNAAAQDTDPKASGAPAPTAGAQDPERRARAAATQLQQINTKKRQILAAIFLAALPTSVLLVSLVGARNLPPINDITTDPENPPQFVAAAEDDTNQGRDLSYPAAFAEQQSKAYPDLAPLELELTPDAALVRAQAVAQELGWKIVSLDAGGALEAQDTSKLFRFVDDIVVRITPLAPEASADPTRADSNTPSVTTDGNPRVRIDIRSKSRDGQGDLGANAARIRRFRAALLEE